MSRETLDNDPSQAAENDTVANMVKDYAAGEWDGRTPDSFAQEFYNDVTASTDRGGSIWLGRVNCWADELQLSAFATWLDSNPELQP